MPDLGNILVVPLRELWPHEAHDFTPWLASNIDQLAQKIGKDLTVVEQEANVGRFSCDIVARELGTDRLVIIENQIAAGDHGHLGQLITYAAGKSASVIVWVAQELRDEYRQALTWLNEHTDSKTEFFGIELDAFRIDSSRPVCEFNVVVAPNGYQKRSAEKTLVATTGRYEKYRDFFQPLIDQLRTKYRFTNSRTAPLQNWMSFGSGVSGLSYNVSFAQGSRVRTELYIDVWDFEANKRIFDEFEQQKRELQESLGDELSWERLDDRRASRIAFYRPGSIDDPAEDLVQIREWNIDRLLRLKRVFGSLLEGAKKRALAVPPRESD